MGLDSVEPVMEVEDRFDVRIPDAEYSQVRTVADLAALLVQHLPAGSKERIGMEQQVLDEVRKITAEHLGLPLEKVLASSDSMKDLDMG